MHIDDVHLLSRGGLRNDNNYEQFVEGRSRYMYLPHAMSDHNGL